MTAPTPSRFPTFVFGQLPFYSGSLGEVVSIVDSWIQQRRKTYICMTNLHSLAITSRDRTVLQIYQNAGLVVPDGMPLVWLGKLLGYPKTERIYGPDVMLALCALAQQKKYLVYFYGTTTSTLEKLKEKLLLLYPKLKLAGFFAPPFRPLTKTESSKIVLSINKSRPHIIFVALTPPEQEKWMAQHRTNLSAHVLVNAGAAFDFVGSVKPQAPPWMRKAGFEWVFRLLHEPRRLWRRYIIAGFRFLWLLSAHFFHAIIPKQK